MPRKSKKVDGPPGLDSIPALFDGAESLKERVVQAIAETSEDHRDLWLDLCSYIAHIQGHHEAYTALGRHVPSHTILKPDIPPAPKRQAPEGAHRVIKRPKNASKARAEREFQDQYYQGRDHDHLDLDRLGCGQCTLMTDDVKFILPIENDMHLEVQTGMRISDPHPDTELSYRTFMVPIPLVEEIFTRANPKKSALKSEAIQFIIIPVAMTGASSIRHELPLPIIFNASSSKATGKILEYGKKGATHASIIENALNAELNHIDKAVQVQHLPTLATKTKVMSGFEASWQASSRFGEDAETKKQHPKGSIYLTERGILFLAQETSKTMYLPFRSIKDLIVLVIKDIASAKKGGARVQGQPPNSAAVEINLVIRATEPWYDEELDPANKKKKKDSQTEPEMIQFIQISMNLLDTIKDYAKTHGGGKKLKYQLCEMLYSDHSAGQPLGGWETLNED